MKAPEAIYQGDPEPFWDMEAKTKLPGFEIFADDTWESDDETEGWKAPAKIPHVDWIEVLDSGNLLSLFGEENPPGMGKDEPAATFVGLKPVEDVELMMLGQEALEDVTALIIDAYGTYKNCTFVPKIIYTGTNSEFESESGTASESSIESEHESVIIPRHHFSFEFESTLMYHAPGAPFLAINEINFAYLAVSEINCVDPNDEEIEFEEEIPKELRSLIERENERHAQPIKEEVISINLKNENNPHMVQIGSGLTPEEFKAHSDLLKEFEDVFAWSHADMPGIDPEIVEHRIPLYPDAKPVKQKLRKMRPDWVLEIKKEVQRQIDAGFLMVTEYPQWVANIVPVPKKNGKIRVCVDFRDLNKASPKDDFPLPHIDVLVDNTAGHALLSFMDGFSGYNQILMAPEDREKTTFTTEWGTYCYRVMPFGLKNAGSTYQRAATTLLHDMIHKEVEVYVDDMIVKAKEREEHLPNLRKFFERIRKYRLRLNPEKCTFGVTAGKMLGFMITTRGIEVDPSKIEAILKMEPPRTEKEIRSFLGKIQFISRFIAKLTSTCEPMFRLLKKGVPFRWDDKCQKAFDAIKKYLQNPPVLMPPIPGQPLILYLSVTPSAMGCMLAQEGEGGSEKAVYYISKKMMGCEERYTSLEKVCWALVWASKKLRHYMLAYSVKLISRMDPLKYLFEKPALTGKLARWLLMLAEFDIKYVTRKSVKGKAVAEFLADHPVEGPDDVEFEFPDENVMTATNDVWVLYFDGAANQKGFGIGVLLVSPEGSHIPLAFKLNFEVTNNQAEYEACIVGMEAALEIGVKRLEVVGDSNLVVSQANGEWKVREDKLKPYHKDLKDLIPQFQTVTFTHVPRLKNRFADALATLASMVEIPDGIKLRPITIEQRDKPVFEYVMVVGEPNDGLPWYHDIWNFIERGEYPAGTDKKDQIALRRLASQYIICGGKLYRRSHCGVHKLCVHGAEATTIMEEIHEGVCGPHMNGMMLAKKILRQGYYWSTMETECVQYVRQCHKCQIHANLMHVPPSELHSMTSPWPFSTWGIDVIGKITPAASNGNKFILVAIDYFTKWVEAASYTTLTAVQVAHFIKQNIIYRYGVPQAFVSDNGVHFKGRAEEVLEEFGIQVHKSTVYRPQTNGAVEAANKTLKTILERTTQSARNWHEQLPLALWGYRTSIRTPTGATPYSLVYGMEAVLPIELEVPSLRVMVESEINEAEWRNARFEELMLFDERRLKALYHVQGYQSRIARAFNKKVKSRDLQEGDMVLKEIRAPVFDPRGKFRPKWAGPYIIKKVLSGGATQLIDLDGNEFSTLVNMDQLKRYYP
ncbi:hypothetical protein Vadar_019075 [Vaccinium darrowii]|uniref:Uncharacterized protein n=1 Tax=Vaccinium darrowii TaxID=229202 RepID=A0ACB7X1V2_9ERIC|nr:hypothetical protein Vadar_019075 [Vaccinium darrowii]